MVLRIVCIYRGDTIVLGRWIFKKGQKGVSDRNSHQTGLQPKRAVPHTYPALRCGYFLPGSRLVQAHIPPHSSPSGTWVHTQLDDTYLCQEQRTLNEITLSLTHKGQADHSLAKTLRLRRRPSERTAPSLLPALPSTLSATVCFLLAPPWLI